MKQNITISTLAAVFAVALGDTAEAKINEIPGISAQPQDYFYTGKPYDRDLESYNFSFRSYNPAINRWTTMDPSGFPNGAHTSAYVGNNPINTFDANGLFYAGTSYGARYLDQTAWIVGKAAAFVDDTSIGNLMYTAMNHADGTTPGDWTLSALQIEAMQGDSKYHVLENFVLNKLEENFSDSVGTGSFAFSTPEASLTFSKYSDAYYGIGSARFNMSGDVSVSYDSDAMRYTATYRPTITMYDYLDYGDHPWTPTQVAHRLQTHGYLHAFNTYATYESIFEISWE